MALYAAADFVKLQYTVIRGNAIALGYNFYPSYYKIQKIKMGCYPSEESISESIYWGKILLQNLLEHTSSRILQVANNKITNETFQNLTLIIKWGCDGAGNQSQYKQLQSLQTHLEMILLF